MRWGERRHRSGLGHFVRVNLSILTVRGGHHTVALSEAVNPDASRWSRAQGGADREPSQAVAWPGFLFVPPFHKPASAGGEDPHGVGRDAEYIAKEVARRVRLDPGSIVPTPVATGPQLVKGDSARVA